MCPFCNIINNIINNIIIDQDDSVRVLFDLYPVTKYHILIIPIDHKSNYFDLTENEKISVDNMIMKWSLKIQTKDDTITGFNIGWNCGWSAGQTIDHAHCHLIPRRNNDIDDPTGGIRGVIPDKRIY